jgi:hypothetical protein
MRSNNWPIFGNKTGHGVWHVWFPHTFCFAAAQQHIESASPDADAVEGSIFVQH